MNIQIQSNILKKLFQNVYFLNGTACAGKSTVVKLLAE
jgi:ABC-type ATPase involved in cell division